MVLTTISASEARDKLDSLMDEAMDTHQPITITGKCGNAILVSEEDWNAVQKTLFLLSVPGIRESIKEGMEEDLDRCSRELDP